jgi:hypothetical protein
MPEFAIHAISLEQLVVRSESWADSNFELFASKASKSFKSLTLDATVSDTSLQKLATSGLSIDEISFQDCDGISKDGIEALAQLSQIGAKKLVFYTPKFDLQTKKELMKKVPLIVFPDVAFFCTLFNFYF